MALKNWVILLSAVSTAAFAQTPASKLEFEVASIKPAEGPTGAGDVSVGMHIDGAQVRLNYMNLKDMLRMAYRVKRFQVEGPEWITTDFFNVAAKLPEGAKREDVADMLRKLLTDRFQLVVRNEEKEFPVLGLVVAKGGLKAKPNAEAPVDLSTGAVNLTASGGPNGVSVQYGQGASYTFADNKFEVKHLTMAQVADALTRYEPDPVVDMTNAPGAYDFVLNFTPEDYRAMLIRAAVGAGVSLPPQALALLNESNGDSMALALETVGLKLERRRAPVQMVIVEKASRTPSTN